MQNCYQKQQIFSKMQAVQKFIFLVLRQREKPIPCQMLIWGVKGLPPKLLFRMHSDLEEALRMPVDLIDFDSQVDFYNLLQRVGELRKIG